MIPDYLTRYFEASRGAFRNLSDLPLDEAEAILTAIRERDDSFASQRKAD